MTPVGDLEIEGSADLASGQAPPIARPERLWGRPPLRSSESSRSSCSRIRSHEPTGERTPTAICPAMLRVTHREWPDVPGPSRRLQRTGLARIRHQRAREALPSERYTIDPPACTPMVNVVIRTL